MAEVHRWINIQFPSSRHELPIDNAVKLLKRLSLMILVRIEDLTKESQWFFSDRFRIAKKIASAGKISRENGALHFKRLPNKLFEQCKTIQCINSYILNARMSRLSEKELQRSIHNQLRPLNVAKFPHRTETGEGGVCWRFCSIISRPFGIISSYIHTSEDAFLPLQIFM